MASSSHATTTNRLASIFPVPDVVKSFFKHFPIHTYPPVSHPHPSSTSDNVPPATLWIAPPIPDIVLPSTNLLSADVECLKWQAYIALRKVTNVAVRWDIDPEGAVDARLPSLYLPPPKDTNVTSGQLLGPRLIPGWVDEFLQIHSQDAFEGYRDSAAKDESRAWVALLEGIVHVTLTSATPKPLSLTSFLLHFPAQSKSHCMPNISVASHLSPPPAPLSGIASIFPPYGERLSSAAIQSQYHDAIVALSDRLGSDQWFLGSPGPTALDALLFAYLHCLLSGPDDVRLEVVRRTNLVNWERRVRIIVQTAFVQA